MASRATRMDEALTPYRDLSAEIDDLVVDIRASLVDVSDGSAAGASENVDADLENQAKTLISKFSALDSSDLSTLKEEIETWRDNMEEKLSHTPKYEEVSECADELDNAISEIDSLSAPEISSGCTRDDLVTALEECRDAIDNAVSGFDNVSFPRAF